MQLLYGVHRKSQASAWARVLAILFIAVFGAGIATQAQAQAVLDIAKQPITQIPADMTSRNVAIHGITLGLPWSEARNILDRGNVPYIFQKGATPAVYIPPTNPTYYFVLNSSSYEIVEMGIIGVSDLPIDNQYLFDGQRWRLTTARMQFFGNEGEYIVSEDGEAYNYPFLGFVLKYVNPSGFRFIMLSPTNKPLTTYGQNLNTNPNNYQTTTTTTTTNTVPQQPTQPEQPPVTMEQDNLQRLLNEFQSARMSFEGKNYSAALSGFRYVADNTDDPLLRIRSIYWMGESLFGMKDFMQAREKFRQVVEETDIASLRDPSQLMIRNCNKALGLR